MFFYFAKNIFVFKFYMKFSFHAQLQKFGFHPYIIKNLFFFSYPIENVTLYVLLSTFINCLPYMPNRMLGGITEFDMKH